MQTETIAKTSSPFYMKFTMWLILVLALTGGAMIFYSTPRGPWVFSDSAGYLDAGRSFAAGRGFVLHRVEGKFVPLHLRPPFYPFILGVMIKLGIDPVEGTRWMNIGLFTSLILVVGIFTYKFTHHTWVSVLLSIYVLTQPELVYNYAGMMTEGIFILLMVLEIVCLVLYIQNKKWWLLLCLIGITGISWMTRFAGVANWLLLGGGILLLANQSIKVRLKTALTACVISAVPFAVWSINLRLMGWSAGSYDFDFQNLWSRTAVLRVSFVDYLWNWLPFGLLPYALHYRYKLIILSLFTIGLAVAVVFIYFRSRLNLKMILRNEAFQMGFLLVGFSFIHLLVIGLSYLFVKSPRPALDDRVSLPSKVAFLLGMTILLYVFSKPLLHPSGAFWVPAVFLMPIIITSIPKTVDRLIFEHNIGFGYTSISRDYTGIEKALKEIPDDVPIITNDVPAVLFFADRAAYLLPELEDNPKIQAVASFGNRGDEKAEKVFREQNGALVLFSNVYSQFNDVYGEEAADRLEAFKYGLFVYYEDQSNGIYFYSEPQP